MNRLGYGLLEWIIAVSLMGLMLPFIGSGLQGVMRYGYHYFNHILMRLEGHYVRHMLQSDMVNLIQVRECGQDIQLTDIDGGHVTYDINHHRFRRRKDRHSMYMTQLLKMDNMNCRMLAPTLLQMDYTINGVPYYWELWVPNAK